MFYFKPYLDHLCTKYNCPLRWKQATTLAKTKTPRCASSMASVPLYASHILVTINSSSTSLNPTKSPDLVQSEFKAAQHPPRSSGDRGWSAPLTVSNLAFSKSHRKFFASVSKWLSQTNVECYFEKTLRNFNKQWWNCFEISRTIWSREGDSDERTNYSVILSSISEKQETDIHAVTNYTLSVT